MALRHQGHRDVAFQPPIEAIEQMKVRTTNFDASYGRFGGGVIAVATKSGTNVFHGTLFETNKTSALSATPWVYNFLGDPKDHFVNNTLRVSNVWPGAHPEGSGRKKSTVLHGSLREPPGTGLRAATRPSFRL